MFESQEKKKIQRIPWLQRRFSTVFPAGELAYVIERLRGTPVRLKARIEEIPAELLKRRDGGTWSIQENVGHLFDVETLWHGRLDDFEQGKQALRPADLENRRTFEADYNAKSLIELQIAFGESRSWLVERLESVDEQVGNREALHPRLNRPMKIVDLMFFAAEHDDHHMARITELIHIFEG
jgi:uncharacterized damage-inducible protein DinB